MAINIGLLIWKEIKLSKISRNELAEMINISRHKMDKIIHSTNIDTEMLTRISIVLNTNFFDFYSRDIDILEINDSIDDKIKSRDQLIDLMEENNRLLQIVDELNLQQEKIRVILQRAKQIK